MKLVRNPFIITAMTVLVLALAYCVSGAQAQAGRWEISNELIPPGMPALVFEAQDEGGNLLFNCVFREGPDRNLFVLSGIANPTEEEVFDYPDCGDQLGDYPLPRRTAAPGMTPRQAAPPPTVRTAAPGQSPRPVAPGVPPRTAAPAQPVRTVSPGLPPGTVAP